MGVRSKPKTLYHYTTADGFLGILASQSIRATSYAFLNDASELSYATDLIDRLALRPSADRLEGQLLCATPLELVQITVGLLTGPADVYVACFSELRDDLNQWRGYGASSADRYCISFDLGGLRQLVGTPSARPASLHRLVYSPQRHETLLRKVVARINERRSTDIGGLIDALTTIKNPSFHAEREWRVSIVAMLEQHHINFGVRGATLIPYINLQMEDEAMLPITEVLVLPSRFPERALKAARMALTAYGYSEEMATLSAVPFVG